MLNRLKRIVAVACLLATACFVVLWMRGIRHWDTLDFHFQDDGRVSTLKLLAMPLPKRFSLFTLLLVMLLVSLVFGYAQWRRLWLLREVKVLNMSGSVIAPLQFTNDEFWPYVSGEAVVVLQRNDDGTFVVDDKSVGEPEAEAFYEAMTDRLHAIGFQQVSYAVMVERGHTRYQVIFRLDDIIDVRKNFADIQKHNEAMLFR